MNRVTVAILGAVVLVALVIIYFVANRRDEAPAPITDGSSDAPATDVKPLEGQSLTVVSFGGAYGAAQKKHMIDPYVEQTGLNVLFEDYPGGTAEIKAQVTGGNILWDVVDIEVVDLERACSEGLVEPITVADMPAGEDGTPAVQDFAPAVAAIDCGVGVISWAIVYAYNNDTIGATEPETLADMFDTQKIPGKRAFRKRPDVNMEWALIADGVPLDQVYTVLATDAGQERALAKLDSIKDDLIWYDSWSQAPQLLNDGSAVLVQSANGRIYSAIVEDKQPFSIVWDGNAYDFDVWAITKGTEKYDLALDFIKFATGTVPLSGMIDVAYGPTRQSSQKYIPSDVANDLPSAHLEEGFKVSASFWADYKESLNEKFNEWLLDQ